jgi:hypothetical protein
MATRGPSVWDPATECVVHWDDSPAPVPEFVFEQRPGKALTLTLISIDVRPRWLPQGRSADRLPTTRRPTRRPP